MPGSQRDSTGKCTTREPGPRQSAINKCKLAVIWSSHVLTVRRPWRNGHKGKSSSRATAGIRDWGREGLRAWAVSCYGPRKIAVEIIAFKQDIITHKPRDTLTATRVQDTNSDCEVLDVAAKSAAVAFCICCCVVSGAFAVLDAAATHKLSPHNGKVIGVIHFYSDV